MEIWLNIPYENEVELLLNYIHNNNAHIKKDRMQAQVIKNGYFWFGYTEDIIKYIQNCGKCQIEKTLEKIPNKPKVIITNGPHVRYQADIWYLPKSLKKNNNYLYVLDIINHFSKWSISYLLKNKESELIISKIKSYINANGSCKIFQTDNGLEFNNNNLKIYLENNNINYIPSAPYHPQTNGCCEALHKQIKQFLLEEYDNKKDKFDIKIAIVNASEMHNKLQHTSTKYEPNFLRNINDDNIIKEVIDNILSSMKRKIEKHEKCPKFSMLLLTPNMRLKGKVYYLKSNTKKKFFIVPSLLINYINDNTISIRILVNYEDSNFETLLVNID